MRGVVTIVSVTPSTIMIIVCLIEEGHKGRDEEGGRVTHPFVFESSGPLHYNTRSSDFSSLFTLHCLLQ